MGFPAQSTFQINIEELVLSYPMDFLKGQRSLQCFYFLVLEDEPIIR